MVGVALRRGGGVSATPLHLHLSGIRRRESATWASPCPNFVSPTSAGCASKSSRPSDRSAVPSAPRCRTPPRRRRCSSMNFGPAATRYSSRQLGLRPRLRGGAVLLRRTQRERSATDHWPHVRDAGMRCRRKQIHILCVWLPPSGDSPRPNQDQPALALPLGLHTVVYHPPLAMRLATSHRRPELGALTRSPNAATDLTDPARSRRLRWIDRD